MELFMRNIDWNSTRLDVHDVLAGVLHGPTFTHFSSTPLNFHIQLHQDKNPVRNHRGTGFLTLPRKDVGDHFLQIYGGDHPGQRIIAGKKTIFFSASKHPNGRTDVVQKVTHRPYQDPRVVQERPERPERERSKLEELIDLFQDERFGGRVKVLQFGWECRDQVFSIESEEPCEDGSDITFNLRRREICINMKHETETYTIAIPFSSINSVTAHTYLEVEHALVFGLNTPPAYELRRAPLRQRLSSLPFILDHERVAPYASLAIRLVCPSAADLRTFRQMCGDAKLRRIYDYEYPVARRDLFSAFKMEQLKMYLAQLDWCISFQIESLVRKMVVDIREALLLMPHIIRQCNAKGNAFTATLIRKFRDRAALLFDPSDPQDTDIVQYFKETQEELEKQRTLTPLKPSDGSLYDAFHVTVTPTTMFLDGPFPERSNRVIRAYDPQHQESFLRVSFVDEARLQYRFDREVDGPEFIRSRLGPLLFDGLTIAQRKFKFLAYSQSALKEHSVWFVKRFEDSKHGVVDAPTIIASLGSFDGLDFDPRLMLCPARYAARISQTFTATDAVEVEVEEIFHDDDISTADKKYQFTDGVGTLSRELAQEIWRQLKSGKRKRLLKDTPSAFQIRFMGSKGMLSVDHRLQGYAISLRPSMIKFETPETTHDMEIARAFDRPGPYFLNRPLIMLLEGLGVPFDVFKEYQDIAVEETRQATTGLRKAAKLLETHGLGTSFRLPSILLSLEKLFIHSLPDDAFYEKMLEYAINHVLRVLKNYARIPVPGGWTLVGVADIHGYLQPDEIFACVKPLNGGRRYLKGPTLVSRSPTIHPGDVMIVNAIGAPPPGSCFELEAIPNAVVFSINGDRPVPSCLGGGDLDGDVYNLIPLEQLPEFRPTTLRPPASYDPAPKKMLDRPSTMDDVAEFFMEYISSDVVGIVAVNWLITADQSSAGIFDPDCLKLASLHSDAVDYPKSGQPVPLKEIPKLKNKNKPDWNAPETMNSAQGNYYESRRAIGRLFRAIDLPVEQQRFRPDSGRRGRQDQNNRNGGLDDLEDTFSQFSLDSAREDIFFVIVEARVREYVDTNAYPDDDEVAFLTQLFSRYASELRAICMANTISYSRSAQLSEEEAVIGTIAQKTSQPRKRKDAMAKLREATDVLVRSIREELAGDDTFTFDDALKRAWAAWEFSISQGAVWGAQSFKWVALGSIFEAIREIEQDESVF